MDNLEIDQQALKYLCLEAADHNLWAFRFRCSCCNEATTLRGLNDTIIQTMKPPYGGFIDFCYPDASGPALTVSYLKDLGIDCIDSFWLPGCDEPDTESDLTASITNAVFRRTQMYFQHRATETH